MMTLSCPLSLRRTRHGMNAAQQELHGTAAADFQNWLALLDLGFSLILLKAADKRAAIGWKAYQTKRASRSDLEAWYKASPNANIGIVTGVVSVNHDQCNDLFRDAENDRLAVGIFEVRKSLTRKNTLLWYDYGMRIELMGWLPPLPAAPRCARIIVFTAIAWKGRSALAPRDLSCIQ